MGSGTQHGSLRIFPFTIPVFRGAIRIEILRPLREVRAIVGGGDERTALWIDPVSGVCGKTSWKDCSTVLQRNSEDPGFALRRDFELVANCVCQKVVRRGARVRAFDSDQLCVVVLDGGDHAFLLGSHHSLDAMPWPLL